MLWRLLVDTLGQQREKVHVAVVAELCTQSSKEQEVFLSGCTNRFLKAPMECKDDPTMGNNFKV